MGSSTRFTRPCSTCGRSLDIPVVHIGREVACSHCGSHFIASANQEYIAHQAHELDERIDRLLAGGLQASERFRHIAPTLDDTRPVETYEV